MGPENRPLRDVLTSSLYPGGEDVGAADVRHRALAEVLCRLPEDGYRQLCGLAGSFTWFIPPAAARGLVCRLPNPNVVYLCPTLESACWDTGILVVARELARLALGESGADGEGQALDLVCAWGFGREAGKQRRVESWRETRARNRGSNHPPSAGNRAPSPTW
jgi:hypothetical protein